MAKVILGMTTSLDGFVNDRHACPGILREGSVQALYGDFATLRDSEPMREAIQNTGAVLMGRNAHDMAENPDWYRVDYEFQVPVFVLTYQPPEKLPKPTRAISFTFVTDGIESAVR
jgi:hypothetical protein